MCVSFPSEGMAHSRRSINSPAACFVIRSTLHSFSVSIADTISIPVKILVIRLYGSTLARDPIIKWENNA